MIESVTQGSLTRPLGYVVEPLRGSILSTAKASWRSLPPEKHDPKKKEIDREIGYRLGESVDPYSNGPVTYSVLIRSEKRRDKPSTFPENHASRPRCLHGAAVDGIAARVG